MIERLHYGPHPYQRIGTQFILDHHRCNLWAKPGMGKSSTVLSTLDLLQLAGSSFFPALVIAPKRVADIVWPTELAKWDAFAGMTMTNIPGTHRERAEALSKPKTDIYVTQYENVQWLVEQFSGERKWPFRIVVADESRRLSGFRLNKGGKRSTALSNIAKFTGRWVNLTGTPAPNGLTDLWGQQWFLDFGSALGRTYTQFVDSHFKVDRYTQAETLLPGADERIHAKIAPLTLALRPEDWFDLELPRYTVVEVELPSAAKPIYKRMERDYFTTVGDIGIEAVNGGVKSMKLLQLASGSIFDADRTVHAVHDAKLEGLESIVSELGEPLLVAYYFTFTPERIQRTFPKARVLKSAQDVADWNAGKIDMMLVHYQSAGHGLNLQDGGRALAYFDEIWDAELREQVLERLGPMRQKQSGHARTVLVYDIITKDTMDVEARERIDSKLSIQDALMLARARRA